MRRDRVMRRGAVARTLAAAAVVACAAFAAACGGDESSGGGGSGSGGKTFKIGLAAPLTGPNAELGQSAQKWADVMEKWLVSDAGPLPGQTVEIVTYDTKLDPATAANVARRMVTRDGVIAMSCCASSTEALQVAAIGAQRKVPSVGGAILTDLTEEGGRTYGWYFRGSAAGEEDTVKYNLAFAEQQGWKRAAISHSSLTFGTVAQKQYEQFSTEFGIDMIGSAALAADATEAAGQASQLAKLRPEVVFLADYPQPTAVITRDLRNAGYQGPIVSNWSAHNQVFTSIAGGNVGKFWAHTMYNAQKPFTQKMHEAYEQVHGPGSAPDGQQNNIEAHSMHIIGMAIAKALETTDDPSGEDVQKALLEIQEQPLSEMMLGAEDAQLTFGRPYVSGSGQNPYHGLDQQSLAMEQPRDGKWVPVR